MSSEVETDTPKMLYLLLFGSAAPDRPNLNESTFTFVEYDLGLDQVY
jgi:hypothetical protein